MVKGTMPVDLNDLLEGWLKGMAELQYQKHKGQKLKRDDSARMLNAKRTM